MSNPDWRAQLRELGVDRRPPPSSSSIQAKVAAVPVETRRPTRPQTPGNVISFAQLDRYKEPEPSESEAPAPIPAPPAEIEQLVERAVESALASPIASEPLPSSEVPPLVLEAPEMATAKRHSTKSRHPEEFKLGIIRECIEGPPGTQARLAKKHGLSDGLISQWVTRYKKREGRSIGHRRLASQQTLVSNGSPTSGPMSVAPNGELPPLPTVALSGLEEYVKALVDREVGRAMREWRRKMLEMG